MNKVINIDSGIELYKSFLQKSKNYQSWNLNLLEKGGIFFVFFRETSLFFGKKIFNFYENTEN